MLNSKKYYEAYDDRYRQVHEADLQWFAQSPSPIVAGVMERLRVPASARILEIGCGEGRDAAFLLRMGCNVLATDVSEEAISFCNRMNPQYTDCFRVLDCIGGRLDERFAYIYAVAVVHMLVQDGDRDGFYRFVREHLTENGIALICTMGDGEVERQSDIRTAFELQKREHQQSGQSLMLAQTSCRMVSFETFEHELSRNGLALLEKGMTAVEPDFPQMMYAVVRRG